MPKTILEHIKLHLSVLLSGFTGLFPKLISLNEVLIVLYRMFLAFLIFSLMLIFMKKKPVETRKNIIKFCLLGALLTIHLMFFFGSIKYSNVSIGVVCYSLVGFFTVFFEPLILKTKFSYTELLYSLIAVGGIWLIFNFDTNFRFGIILGIISAAIFALYTVWNKIAEKGKSARCMLFYELLGGTVAMSLFCPIYLKFNPTSIIFPTGIEWGWLIILAFFCTILLYLIYIDVLKKLSAFTVSLAGNLEPVYGILLAMLFFNEAHQLSPSFYIGLGLILLSVFAQSLIKNNTNTKHTI